MSAVDRLREWGNTERDERGLVDIHFFPGSSPGTIEDAASAVLDALAAPGRDITNEAL